MKEIEENCKKIKKIEGEVWDKIKMKDAIHKLEIKEILEKGIELI